MNCSQVSQLLPDYIDGDLSDTLLEAVTEHHQNCSACNNKYQATVQLRAQLQEIPVPPFTEGFVDRALKQATEYSTRQKTTRYTVSAGVIAAGFAIWFITASTLITAPTNITNDTNEIYSVMVSDKVQTIKLAIQSERDLSGVRMSVELSPNLELSGYGNRTSINWNTGLKKGRNIIKLPIVGLASGNGKITTRVQMNGKEKVMHIQTNYQTPNNVWLQTHTTTST